MVSASILNPNYKNDGENLLKTGDREEFVRDFTYHPQPIPRSRTIFTNACFNLLGLLSLIIILFLGIFMVVLLEQRQHQLNLQKNTKIFNKNFADIKKYRIENPEVQFEENTFIYKTEDELKMMLMDLKYLNFSENRYFETFDLPQLNSTRPDHFDWRDSGKVMSVKNQGGCGSCWAFATVAAVETQYAIHNGGSLWSLSEQELVDCDGRSFGCAGGFVDTALLFIVKNGLETEDDYPYEAVKHNQCRTKGDKTRVRIDKGYYLPPDEDKIADWVANVGPVAFALPVPKSIMYYKSGIYSPSPADCSRPIAGHAMSIVGYGIENGKPFWTVKNSWGSTWGESGFMKMSRGNNVCGFKKNVVAPVIN